MAEFFTQFKRFPVGGVRFTMPSKTEQAHKDEYDLNRLLARATKTGVLATAEQIRDVYFGDFSEIGQAFENHLKLREAEEHFMALPSKVREYFENDPKKLLKALADDSVGNVSKLIELGLVKKPDPVRGTSEDPLPVPAIPAAPQVPAVENVKQ